MLVVAAMLAATFLTVFVAHAQTKRDAPTTRFYDSRGNLTGSASTYGNQTRFFDARYSDNPLRNRTGQRPGRRV